ncbi:putative acetyltransferase [Bacillus mesophilus]|uniref:GNAT family N-acetyltransferase n=1 Tax=Bacillus mesophilus TaxID=1808955 RepID=A0A6M0Q686_9BACI|nr:GNAT family N-acetyltransferase [Bacillus mesophilus]MBM7660596.1 putative acetyltransferase [Bacillus mesophilus]NEY71856.1 GNAT family N-acetyltransferase [Bacillus mesophilus]
MVVTLQKVLEEDKVILRNLYSLYLHDLSKFTTNIDIGEDGFFHFKDLDIFWKVEGITPYFIKNGADILGFILLLERPFLKKENDLGINDIFILNKYKGKGYGKKALHLLFSEKRGSYFVIKLINNTPAVSFWKSVYREFSISFIEREELVEDENCLVQTFTI